MPNILFSAIVFPVYRVVRQPVTAGVSVLGGLSYKVRVPDHEAALQVFLSAMELNVPPCPHYATVYRIAIHG